MKLLIALGLVAAFLVVNAAIDYAIRHFAGITTLVWFVLAVVVYCLYAFGVRIERR